MTLTPGYEPPALATRMMRGECARMGRVHNGYDATQGDRIEEDPTGLLNEGFRYRDLETGSFITRDPAGFVDGPNLYTYVRQNPWTKFDAEGLSDHDLGVVFFGYYVGCVGIHPATEAEKAELTNFDFSQTSALIHNSAGFAKGFANSLAGTNLGQGEAGTTEGRSVGNNLQIIAALGMRGEGGGAEGGPSMMEPAMATGGGAGEVATPTQTGQTMMPVMFSKNNNSSDSTAGGSPEGTATKGAKRGPKPDGEGLHNQTIAKRIDDLKKQFGEDWKHTGGGDLTEQTIQTPGENKNSRRMDITFENMFNGEEYYENVGKTKADGTPVKREVQAQNDVEKATGTKPAYTPYDR